MLRAPAPLMSALVRAPSAADGLCEERLPESFARLIDL